MPLTPKKILLSGMTAVGVVAMLAGCGAAPKSSTSAGGSASSSTSATANYLPCVVGDVGGFNDHSFNQLSLQGVQQAAQALGTKTPKKIQSQSSSDYAPAFSSLVAQKCNIIVAAGFQFPKALGASAQANPKIDYAMIDDNSLKLPNVKDIVFETDEAAFLGGYAAAAYSKTGVVATWGGAKYPTVTIYMDGIADGVKYFNQQKHKNVKLLGWDEASQNGSFVGGFTDQNKAKQLTQGFLDQKADVIIPVAGSLYQGGAAAITGSKSTAVLEGVDADLYLTDPKYKSLILTSILKKVDVAAKDVVEQAAKGQFDNTTYIGDLKNGGVGLSPFHDFASKVPSGLQSDLDAVKAGILDGSIKVESPASLKK
jgi:basic membrane protein A and related proteins